MHFHSDKIVPFVCDMLSQWKDVASVKEIGYLVLDMYGVWTMDAVKCVQELDDEQGWSVLTSINVKSTNAEVIKYVTDALYLYITHNGMDDTRKIRMCVRVIQKLSVSGDEERVNVVMRKLYDILGDPIFSESVCDVLDDLSERVKDVNVEIVLEKSQVEKLIHVINRGCPSVFTVLTKYKLGKGDTDDSNLAEEVIKWAMRYINSGVFPVVMNAMKCVLYYKSDNSVSDVLPQILRGLDTMIEEGGMTEGYKRTLFFDVLRNMILLVVEYGGEGFRELMEKYVQIYEVVDVEPYIIDTKLELMYLLSVHGGDLEREKIGSWLCELSRCGNEELSYKAVRTVGNLYIKHQGKGHKEDGTVMETLVSTLNVDKHLLALGIALREVGGNIAKKYATRIGEHRAEVYTKIGNGRWKDDDVIGYIGTLSVLGEVEELVLIQEFLWKRVEGRDSRVMIMDAYVNALVQGYVASGGKEQDRVLNILQKASEEMGTVVADRIECLLSQRDVVTQDSLAGIEARDSELAVSAVSLGTLACLYMRSL